MEHYVTLVSNASMDLFPNNRLSSFRTRLPYLHDFSDGDWVVGLTEITYTKSWFNVREGHHISPAFLDDGELVKELKAVHFSKIRPGFYPSAQDLVDHLNSLMASWPKKGSVMRLPELEIKNNQKLALKVNGYQKLSAYVDRDFGAKFDDELAELLGISSNRPAYLDQGMTSLFVYCDIVQPQVVGDSFEPLLRTVGVNSDVVFGNNVTEIFELPYYLPLSQKTFQEISINIRNDSGKAPHFNFGRVTVTLHFVRQ